MKVFKKFTVRTFQEIYDFCRLNNNYRAYFDIPDQFQIKDIRKYNYYYRELNKEHGQSRKGSYIYGQSMNELKRFMGNTDHDIYLHINLRTCCVIRQEDDDFDNYRCFYVIASIAEKGIWIVFGDPFGKTYERYSFYARSHYHYNEEGIVKEIKKYLDRYFLFPAGRWRNLQIRYGIKKEDFVWWYRNVYKEMQKKLEASDYWDMIEKYTPEKQFVDYEDAENMLVTAGLFFDFGIDDEYSRHETVCEFMEICNS